MNTIVVGLDRITFDPEVMAGRACIRGLRITVALVLNLIANRMTMPDIIREYPDLEPEDIEQALHYAAFLAREELVPFAVLEQHLHAAPRSRLSASQRT